MDFQDQLAQLELLVPLELMAFLALPVLQELSVQVDQEESLVPQALTVQHVPLEQLEAAGPIGPAGPG